jgi:hypothetical protein
MGLTAEAAGCKLDAQALDDVCPIGTPRLYVESVT